MILAPGYLVPRPRIRPPLAAVLLVIILTMCSAIGVLLSLLLLALGLVLKGFAGVGGKVLLFMTLFPWPAWALAMLIDAFVIRN